MEHLNQNRTVPGLNNISPIPSRRKQCPFGMDCKTCMIALNVKNNIKCSISVLAAEALKTGIKIGSNAK